MEKPDIQLSSLSSEESNSPKAGQHVNGSAGRYGTPGQGSHSLFLTLRAQLAPCSLWFYIIKVLEDLAGPKDALEGPLWHRNAHGFGMCCEGALSTLQTILEPRNSWSKPQRQSHSTDTLSSGVLQDGGGWKDGPEGSLQSGGPPSPIPLNLSPVLSFLWSRSHVHTALCSPLVPLSFYQLPTPKTLLCSSGGPAPSQRALGVQQPLVRRSVFH